MYKLQNLETAANFEVYHEDSQVKMSWDEANEYCHTLGSNWRLPTLDELKIIYSELFKASKGGLKPSFYWSSITANVNYRVYFMNFAEGKQNNGEKTGPAYAIAVRSI